MWNDPETAYQMVISRINERRAEAERRRLLRTLKRTGQHFGHLGGWLNYWSAKVARPALCRIRLARKIEAGPLEASTP